MCGILFRGEVPSLELSLERTFAVVGEVSTDDVMDPVRESRGVNKTYLGANL